MIGTKTVWNRTRSSLWMECTLSAPSVLWLLVFFLLPTLLVFSLAFRPTDPYGGVGEGWTLQTIAGLVNPSYPPIIWRTFWLSALTTLVCLAVALPVAYAIARSSARYRSTWLLLVVVPFWTNFLIRIFAWKVLLHPEGLVKEALYSMGLIEHQTMLLYRPSAVLVVLVYTYLPFAILPIYAAAEKFDFQLLEAARDLGASRWRSIQSVFLPGIRRGIVTAALVVFIPALGSYVIPDVVGGPAGEMIGNKIAQRVFVDRNIPQASVLSAALTLAVVLPMIGMLVLQRQGKGEDRLNVRREVKP